MSLADEQLGDVGVSKAETFGYFIKSQLRSSLGSSVNEWVQYYDDAIIVMKGTTIYIYLQQSFDHCFFSATTGNTFLSETGDNQANNQ